MPFYTYNNPGSKLPGLGEEKLKEEFWGNCFPDYIIVHISNNLYIFLYLIVKYAKIFYYWSIPVIKKYKI
ncbi:hypothetical protein SAMN05660242_3410 [Thermoanaerobacterium sp. RBIITD]|nr:hypothetical protein SAMN05660242_3410 [Thermoanaerobacterium sp. RBIITD]